MVWNRFPALYKSNQQAGHRRRLGALFPCVDGRACLQLSLSYLRSQVLLSLFIYQRAGCWPVKSLTLMRYLTRCRSFF